MNRLSAFVAMLSCVCCFGAEPFFKVEPENPLIRDAIYDKAQGDCGGSTDDGMCLRRNSAGTLYDYVLVVPDRASLSIADFRQTVPVFPSGLTLFAKDLVPEFVYGRKGAGTDSSQLHDLLFPKGRFPIIRKVKVNY